MGKKRYTPEQIVAKLRQAEVELAKGQATGVNFRYFVLARNRWCRRQDSKMYSLAGRGF